MKAFIILALFVATAFAQNECGVKWVCQSALTTSTPNACRVYDATAKQWNLKACASGQMCSPVQPSNSSGDWNCTAIPTTPAATTKHNLAVGTAATDKTLCQTEFILDGKCAYQVSGGACDGDYNCDKKMTCSSGKCTASLDPGATCTAANANTCAHGTVCAQAGTATAATCMTGRTVDDGTIVKDAAGTASQAYGALCKSGKADTTGKCVADDTTKGGYPLLCSADADCVATAGTAGRCRCVATKDGKGYCSGFGGDIRDIAISRAASMTSAYSSCYPWQYSSYWGTGCESTATGKLPSLASDSCYTSVGLTDWSVLSASGLFVNFTFVFGLLAMIIYSLL